MSATRRIRHAQTAVAVAALLLLSACMQQLPGAPSDVTSGVTIYEHAGFEGGSALLKRDVRDLRDYTGACRHETSIYPYGTTVTFDWMLADGSTQASLWGINLYPDVVGDDWLEFDSMINLRLSFGNRSRGVDDAGTRTAIAAFITRVVRR
jgi:hypothetical protein